MGERVSQVIVGIVVSCLSFSTKNGPALDWGLGDSASDAMKSLASSFKTIRWVSESLSTAESEWVNAAVSFGSDDSRGGFNGLVFHGLKMHLFMVSSDYWRHYEVECTKLCDFCPRNPWNWCGCCRRLFSDSTRSASCFPPAILINFYAYSHYSYWHFR